MAGAGLGAAGRLGAAVRRALAAAAPGHAEPGPRRDPGCGDPAPR